jgi:catechol 2,3-dioxygenase-like lactoylglutathione lyase family enzyme
MFSHVMVGVNTLEASKKFYDAPLGTLGVKPGFANLYQYFDRSPIGTLQFRRLSMANCLPREWRHHRVYRGFARVG